MVALCTLCAQTPPPDSSCLTHQAMPLDIVVKTVDIVQKPPRSTAAAVYMQALASPPETAYLQRYPLRDNLPASARVATPLATPGPRPEAPPPAGTTRDNDVAPSPRSTSPAPGPGGPDDAVLAPTPEPPTTQPVDTANVDDGDGGPRTSLMAGSAVAVIAALFICVAVAMYVIARRRRMQSSKTTNAEAVRACGKRPCILMTCVPRPPCHDESTDGKCPAGILQKAALLCSEMLALQLPCPALREGPTQCCSDSTMVHAYESSMDGNDLKGVNVNACRRSQMPCMPV